MEIVQAPWPQELPLFFIMKDCISGRDMFDNNGASLENSGRIWMEVLSSSLTKDQHYLYRGGYASNFSEVKHMSSSNRTKWKILKWGRSKFSKSQNMWKLSSANI